MTRDLYYRVLAMPFRYKGKTLKIKPEQMLRESGVGAIMDSSGEGGGCATLCDPSSSQNGDNYYYIRVTITGLDIAELDVNEAKIDTIITFGKEKLSAANMLQKLKDSSGSTLWIDSAGRLKHPKERGTGDIY